MNPLIELEQLIALFPEPNDQPLFIEAKHIAREAAPEPYHRMLVHEHHMTVTMESYHDCRVNVVVLESCRENNIYSRKILLRSDSTGDVVQFGIVRFDFGYVTDTIRQEIESGLVPLGRVLIQHNVLRHIDLGAIIGLTAGPGLSRYLDMAMGETTYGRMATIFCDGAPAIDLLEVSTPLN